MSSPSLAPAPALAASTDLEVARRTLRLEAHALEALADTLGREFADAVELMHKGTGRVIVTGMGKSGHIARKIAATMASTGTPAHFVHPGEASHGDLGMITREDVLLVMSNSGETAELGDIIAHAKRFSIPLIGIASKPDSRLLNAADIRLLLPPIEEACRNGLAPTTSTTMTLALGDALAMALMERRQFTAEQFKTFHPGGKLGHQLMIVAELMHGADDLPLVAETAPMHDVLLTMTSKSFGAAGVTGADGGLVGIITDGDLRRHMDPQNGKTIVDLTAAEVMTPAPKTIRAGALVAEALGFMNDRNITCLFVVADGNESKPSPAPVGILHIHDCLRAGFV